jgi:hypothetical protein
MKGEIFECARPGCNNVAQRKAHNQKYCSDECCMEATKQRAMEKYYERRDRKRGKERFCVQCKDTKLSRYNESKVCSECVSRNREVANIALVNMLNTASITN